ncbi:hypothetical protein ACF3DV_14495 [Chlorogloeopsis fritschii PCC 9212]|uniref:Lipoprotein n=1 Tax=Chlorogloeopsis fritschii PCC 6912 TaxID=211165 RepID=A0A3S1A2Z6_CHLFR|nr:hypothetical protein [Chlorogloeopsis fritschii]RUR86629.1 hypothetical protein PCC6912_00720 [Chlorogloeopsis fritschii PCC 6912]
MKKTLRKTIVAFAVIATLTTGCRSTDEYKKFAKAGSEYANAVDKLLEAASDIRIDTTSEQLLRNDRILNQTIEDYKKLTEPDEKRLEVIGKLRKHNELLREYFRLLNELASSDAPTRAQGEITGVVNNLNKIGKELQGSDLITNPGLLQGITNLVVSSQIRGALRDELEKRNRTIMLELTIQKEMLKALGDSIEQDAKLIRIAEEERFVIRPLIEDTEIADKDAWIETRREILIRERRGKELKNASNALGKFQEVFQGLVEGTLSLTRLNSFLQDVDNFLQLVEADKKAK